MSFSYRDKPRLSERLRGKSGDEILNEMKEHLDQDRKMFFETNPSWTSTPMTGPFSRAGFPFEDDMMSRGRHDIRSHLDDLAQRHPEFADHLRCPPWGGEASGPRAFGRKRRGSGSGEEDIANQASGASGSSMDAMTQNEEERGRLRPGGLNQHGLRNTVDLGQQQQQDSEEKGGQGQGRGQRSMSAPPDNRAQQQPQRFVSRIEINPVNPADPSSVGRGPSTVTSDSHGKPPMPPKQPQHQQTPPKQTQSGNVRHIPIFVEGRDEPLLPKVRTENVEQVFTSRVPQPGAEQSFHQPHNFARPPFPSQQQFHPQQQQQNRNFQSQHTAPPSPKQQRQTKPQAHQPQPPPQPPKQPEAPPANDAVSRVQAVAKDVADLQLKVDTFTCTSRKDKDYMYLDEMLTRNLLKLDDIETDGKDNVRQARKEVIGNIQRCISILEGKAPTEENKTPCEVMDTTAEDVKLESSNGVMEVVAETKEAPVAGVEPKSETQEPQKPRATEKPGASGDLPMEVEEEKPPQQAESEKSVTEEVKTDSGDKNVAEVKQETDSGAVKETKPSS